jgi:hypothetical protein
MIEHQPHPSCQIKFFVKVLDVPIASPNINPKGSGTQDHILLRTLTRIKSPRHQHDRRILSVLKGLMPNLFVHVDKQPQS